MFFSLLKNKKQGVNGKQPGILQNLNVRTPTSSVAGVGCHGTDHLIVSSKRIDISNTVLSAQIAAVVKSPYSDIQATSVSSFDLKCVCVGVVAFFFTFFYEGMYRLDKHQIGVET
jgi:hypothetical protein